MIWLLYYLVACWCIATLMAICFWKEFEAISESEPQVDSRKAIPVFVFTGPIWMPYILVGGVSCVREIAQSFLQIWQAHRFRQTFREYTFRPANFFQLPQEVRDWWDASTPKFFPMGFSLLGDFQLRDEPYQMNDRFYWHESGTMYCSACAFTLVEISDLTYDMTSWLEDGTNVITATAEGQSSWKMPNPLDDKLHMTLIPGATAEEVFARHCQEVTAIAEKYRLRVLAFAPEQHQALVIHNQRVFCGWLHRAGSVTAPPAPVLPEPCAKLGADQFLTVTAGVTA